MRYEHKLDNAQKFHFFAMASDPGFGNAMLRLAHMAAAQHRAQVAESSGLSWSGLTRIDESIQDKAGHGSPVVTRSTRAGGAVTTEGDR